MTIYLEQIGVLYSKIESRGVILKYLEQKLEPQAWVSSYQLPQKARSKLLKLPVLFNLHHKMDLWKLSSILMASFVMSTNSHQISKKEKTFVT